MFRANGKAFAVLQADNWRVSGKPGLRPTWPSIRLVTGTGSRGMWFERMMRGTLSSLDADVDR
jgi:hypothetical protein